MVLSLSGFNLLSSRLTNGPWDRSEPADHGLAPTLPLE